MNLRLRYVLAIAFILIATIPVVLLGTWVEESAIERETSMVSEKHLLLAQNLTGGLERYARDTRAVFDYLTATATSEAPSPAGLTLANEIGFRHFCLIDDEGRISVLWPIAGDRKPTSGGTMPRRILAALDMDTQSTATFSNVIADGSGRPTIFLSRRLPSGQIAVAGLDLGFIREAQGKVTFGRGGHAAIVDQAGNVIAHPRKDWQDSIKNVAKVKPVAQMMAGNTGVTTFFAPAVNKTMITGYSTVPGTGWGVMVPQPMAELEARADQVRQMAIGIIIVGLVAAALISWALAGLLVRPVEAAARAAKEIAAGHLEARVPAYSGGAPAEYRELGTAFNDMAQGVATAQAERDEAEKHRLDALVSAEQANRAKSDFLANMSHELRSPLNAIIGFSDLMKRQPWGPLGDDRYKGYAQDINWSSQHLLSVINDMLDISKIEAGKATLKECDVDLDSVVNECRTMMAVRSHESGVELCANVPADMPLLRADARNLKQILINLLANAVEFTPPGGSVQVNAHLGDFNGRPGAVVITVSDTGIGIAECDIPTILRPFGQARHSYVRSSHGTGLGLSICKSLIELHGGRLEIDSVVGEGTTVTVRFPPERTMQRSRVSA